MPHPYNPFLLTSREAARFLGITGKQLKRLVDSGMIEPRQIEGMSYFHQDDLYRYRQERKKKTLQDVTARLLRALGLRVRFVFFGDNGHERDLGDDMSPGKERRPLKGGK